MGCTLTVRERLSSIPKMKGAFQILDESTQSKWPRDVQLPDDIIRLILVFQGGCVVAWQRDRIGSIYSKVYREFFGQRNGTRHLQTNTCERLLPYYCAFVTYLLSKDRRECRFSRYGRFHKTQRVYKSRKYFRPWSKLVKQYKLEGAIARLACKTEAPLIHYYECARRRFQAPFNPNIRLAP